MNWLYHLNANPYIPPKLPLVESITCRIIKIDHNVPCKQMRYNWTIEHPDKLINSSAKLTLQADDWIGEVLWIDSCEYVQLKHHAPAITLQSGWKWSDDYLRKQTVSSLEKVQMLSSSDLPLSVLIARLNSPNLPLQGQFHYYRSVESFMSDLVEVYTSAVKQKSPAAQTLEEIGTKFDKASRAVSI